MTIEGFADHKEIERDSIAILRSPRRVRVSQNAAETLRIETPGGMTDYWDAALTPYMVEPMDTLKSRSRDAVVFVAPARSGKTQAMLDAWLAHAAIADPGDMAMYFSTQKLAYDYRKRRIERMHRNSESLRAKISSRAHDTTIEMITYRNGMILNLGWPTSSQLAQRDLRYVALSDYDSFPDDIGGEGSPFDLAKKRIQVAMSAGMALVESSPKRPIVAANWEMRHEHEAPPVSGGILPLYNRGDRRRWYWSCIDGCGERFEAPAMPAYAESEDETEAGRSAHVVCPHCGHVYRQNRKRALNASGRWIAQEGREDSPVASFWVLGCAAAFQNWASLVANYVLAKRELNVSGDETALAATVNTDQGLPYRPLVLAGAKDVMQLEARREKGTPRYYVPEGVRVLFASVDVQADRFEVCVMGYGSGRERWLVDRYALRNMPGVDMLQPTSYLEHWEVLIQRVVESTYRLPDEKELRVHRVAVDSGGWMRDKQAKATAQAYDWWRSLRKRKLAHRVWLVRGAGRQKSVGPIVRKTYPDSTKNAQSKSGSAGDIPVIFIRTDAVKDTLHLDLQREDPGPGYVHLPDWLESRHIGELCAEVRGAEGWKQVTRRNETWDLFVYADALWYWEKCNRINWEHPPPWAAPWERNSGVISKEQGKQVRKRVKRNLGFGSDEWVL